VREPFDSSEGLLTAEEMAALMGVDRRTVLTWARNWDRDDPGPKIPAVKSPGGGVWRFSRKWIRERQGDG
jgi:hypothetical protein